MPRPAPDAVCSSEDPRVKCAGRFDAGLRGEFLYSFRAQGYVWTAMQHEGVTGTWTRCPWCRQSLPDQGAIYRRLREGIGEEED